MGGLIGRYNGDNSHKIFHSFATGAVNGIYTLGGLIGQMNDGVVSQSYATGDVIAAAGDDIGGFIGRSTDGDNNVRIRNSYATGDVTVSVGEGNASSFIGYSNQNTYITRVYATGAVTTDLAFGGLSGNGGFGAVAKSFWDTETTGATTGCDNGPCGGEGKTTAQMKTEATYTAEAWDFDTIWDMSGGTNSGYPFLTMTGVDTVPNDSIAVGPTETILGTNGFVGGGEAMGWQGDDDEFSYRLPFSFNFYGEDYDTAYVSTNGFVSFGSPESSYGFAVDNVQEAPLIQVFGGDLDTGCGGAEDIYVTDTGNGSVTFRWQSSVSGNCEGTDFNFEIVLNSNNTFQLHYGDMTGDVSNESRAVGVQDGYRSYVASAYNELDDYDNLDTSSWVASPVNVVSTIEITSCEELMAADQGTSRSSTLVLKQNIDCDNTDDVHALTWPGGFSGVFNGQGHTITKLHVEDEEYVGLFSRLTNAEVQNVHFTASSVYADQGYGGILAGYVNATNIRNVSASDPGMGDGVTVFNDGYAGGLIGFATNENPDFDMKLSGLSSSVDVYGYEDVGGLIGELENDEGKSITLSNSFATGNVSYTDEESGVNFGGLIGDLEVYAENNGTTAAIVIEDSYAAGDVSGFERVAGLVGDVSASTYDAENSSASLDIRRTYASGDVTATYNVAGALLGELDYNNYAGEHTTIENNFAVGSVIISQEGGNARGFIGIYDEGGDTSRPVASTNNYFDTSGGLGCSGGDDFAGCVGIDEDDQPGYFQNNATNAPLTTWDFNNVWVARSNDYPVLFGWDFDNDGIADAVENAAPNGGDANGDGVQDSQQANVTGFVNPVTGKYATLAVDQASSCTIASVMTQAESSHAVQDAGFSYALGLMNFRLACTSGATAQVSQYYFDANSSSAVGRKYNPTTNAYFTIASAAASDTTIGGKSVAKLSYALTDNSILDLDATAGSILDPAGLGTSVLGAPNTGFRTK